MQTTTIKIRGMTCMGCANSIKTVLGSLTGVEHAEVSLDHGQAVVQHDPEQASREQLETAIISAGFEIDR